MTGNRHKICFITGTRADFGIMSPLIRALSFEPTIDVQIIATNMHLSPSHGMTVAEIEQDGFIVDRKVTMNRESDSPEDIVRSMGEEMKGMAEALSALKPDLIVILGDRYEMLVASSAALMFSIPVAHLYGGETTEGAVDDDIRNAITMMSAWHFTSTEAYRRRIISMGKSPESVFHIGALGADNISNFITLTIEELEKSINFRLSPRYLLVTFHPVTREHGQAVRQTEELLKALEQFAGPYKILFTMPNSDSEGDDIAAMIKRWAENRPEDVFTIESLGRERYYSAVAHAEAVVGNSSSGLTEAPSFGTPTVNIGNRQRGRAYGTTVIHCATEAGEIAAAIRKAVTPAFKKAALQTRDNPYFLPGTLGRLRSHLIDIVSK